MKTSILTTIGLTVAIASSAFADAPSQAMTTSTPSGGFFIGVESGPFWLSESVGNYSASFNTGWGITVPIGYDYGNGLSTSVSVGYSEADFNIQGFTGTESFVPIMANVAYSIKLADNFHWDIGAGLGMAFESGTVNAYGGLSSSGTDFGFQAFTGLRYDFTPGFSAKLGYRLLYVDSSFSNGNVGPSASATGQTVELGLFFKF